MSASPSPSPSSSHSHPHSPPPPPSHGHFISVSPSLIMVDSPADCRPSGRSRSSSFGQANGGCCHHVGQHFERIEQRIGNSTTVGSLHLESAHPSKPTPWGCNPSSIVCVFLAFWTLWVVAMLLVYFLRATVLSSSARSEMQSDGELLLGGEAPTHYQLTLHPGRDESSLRIGSALTDPDGYRPPLTKLAFRSRAPQWTQPLEEVTPSMLGMEGETSLLAELQKQVASDFAEERYAGESSSTSAPPVPSPASSPTADVAPSDMAAFVPTSDGASASSSAGSSSYASSSAPPSTDPPSATSSVVSPPIVHSSMPPTFASMRAAMHKPPKSQLVGAHVPEAALTDASASSASSSSGKASAARRLYDSFKSKLSAYQLRQQKAKAEKDAGKSSSASSLLARRTDAHGDAKKRPTKDHQPAGADQTEHIATSSEPTAEHEHERKSIPIARH